MIYKNNTILIKTLALIIFAVVFAMIPVVANAQVPLEVVFEQDPLFDEANFLPGNEVIRTVEVTNNTEATQTVLVEAINAIDDDGLGDELDLVIKEGEISFLNLLDAIKDNKPKKTIKGIAYKENNKIKINTLQPSQEAYLNSLANHQNCQ